MASSAAVLGWLRAAGEPTRLRLLALCSQRDLSVSDLAELLGQSEPRVSRHLKILCEAGLLVRLRQGQWVHYRVGGTEEASGFVQGLLARVDPADPLRSLGGEPPSLLHAAAPVPSRLGRSLQELLERRGPGAPRGAVLLAGVMRAELLEWAAAAAECIAIAHSRRAAHAARSWLERRGLRARVLVATGTDTVEVAHAARGQQPFQTVLLDHLALPDISLPDLLAAGRRVLDRSGRLWLFERYDALESRRERVVEHPLARMRRLLAEAGLGCERLQPIEADGEHVLAAHAHLAEPVTVPARTSA